MPRSSSTSRRHRSASEIRKLLSRFHSSSLSRAQFVQTESLCLATLRRYLNTHPTQTPRTSQCTRPPAFLELEPAYLPPASSPQRGDYRLQLKAGVVLEIPQVAVNAAALGARGKLYSRVSRPDSVKKDVSHQA
jgi:hypothetical protein